MNNNSIPNQLHFMVVPSLYCPAGCHYCFGPNRGPKMTRTRTEQTVHFIQKIDNQAGLDKIKVTFHGGEPLAAGYNFFQSFLEQLSSRFNNKKTELNIQSNLWFLDNAYCDLFKKYNVSIGTSLDGPEALNDAQRGKGYFKRTMTGINMARDRGLDVGCIVTFTRSSNNFWREIMDFFISEQISFSVHTAVALMGHSNSQYALSQDEKMALFLNMFDYYIQNRKKISISTFDQIAKGILNREGHMCTFRDCLGMFLVIDPEGNIYPCQRFCGNLTYRLANLDDNPSMETLFTSPIAMRMKRRQQHIAEVCSECSHYAYCKGGCCYNAWAIDESSSKDPFCAAHSKIFEYIHNRLICEMESEENIAAITENPKGQGYNLLLKKGPLIEIVRSDIHPSYLIRNAKRLVAAVELAKGPDISSVTARLVQQGICQNQTTALASIENLQKIMSGINHLNNLYLHLTFACQLHCSHCYARAGSDANVEMPLKAVEYLIRQARETGFRQVIITGGEPLIYSQRDKLLVILNRIRPEIIPMNLVLRTNMAMPLADTTLAQIAGAFHKVIVSIDGDKEAHDARRGAGSYTASVEKLETYQMISRNIQEAAELSINAVLLSRDVIGEQGQAVRELANRIGVRIRFKPFLPLGRASECDVPSQSEALGGYFDPMELIEKGYIPIVTCGIGQNLYVEPSGESFPCYSYHRSHAFMGNVIKLGLTKVIETKRFKDLLLHTVDTNRLCRSCEYRYLCGGACRAWGDESAQHDLDAPPAECAELKQRAIKLYNAACEYLNTE